MSVAAPPVFAFDNSFARDLAGLFEPWQPAPVPAPTLLALNQGLAIELGADPGQLGGPEGLAVLAGNAVPTGAMPIAQAYAGHQFGGYSPRLGDGRALLLGEVVDQEGRRRDLHMKGSGRTPFARGGDGLAGVGPMLREFIMCEAMHALGIPTTRALSVVATGGHIRREALQPGAVLIRTAASHIRVGTFQYAARLEDPTALRRLADHTIARHYPDVATDDRPYVALLREVADAQAALVARWMLVGFIHGVMNTDNMTVSGETIDYGPCAFMDSYDARTVFSSIDHAGRYAYGNQPAMAQWNLTRLAEALLPLLADDREAAIAQATEVLVAFPERYNVEWETGMRSKLGLVGAEVTDESLATDLVALLQDQSVDFTLFFRALAASVRGDDRSVQALLADPGGAQSWLDRWRAVVVAAGRDPQDVAVAMDAVNPLCIPRNHLVEEALDAAVEGDMAPFRDLVGVLAGPFEHRSGDDRYTQPAPPSFGPYQTFCGT